MRSSFIAETATFWTLTVTRRVLWVSICLSIHLSILLSGPPSSTFLGIGSLLVFPETLYGVRVPYGDVCDSLIFLKKSQKWSQNGMFGLLRKISSLVLSGNGVEWKYLWPLSILWKPHMWQKPDFQVMQISVFFNCQYLINRLTSDSDFLHVGRHEWMQQDLVMCFRANKLFWAKKWHVNFGFTLKILFEILHNERGQKVHGNYINSFSEKNLIWGKWAIFASW